MPFYHNLKTNETYSHNSETDEINYYNEETDERYALSERLVDNYRYIMPRIWSERFEGGGNWDNRSAVFKVLNFLSRADSYTEIGVPFNDTIHAEELRVLFKVFGESNVIDYFSNRIDIEDTIQAA